MSDERELKLECLRLAYGDVVKAREMYEWVAGPAYVVTSNGVGEPVSIAALTPAPAQKFAPMTFECDGVFDGGNTGFSFKRGEEVPAWMLGPEYNWNYAPHLGSVVVTGPAQSTGKPAPAPVDEVEIPEGFTKWEGGEWTVEDGALVETIWRDGRLSTNDADIPARHAWNWQHGFDRTAPRLDIIAYRIIEASTTEDANHIEGASEAVPVPGTGEESRDQSEDAPAFAKADDAPDQSAYTDADAGLEPGNLTPAEIDEATAELFAQAGERDGLRAADFAPVVAVEDAPPTNPEADALAKAHDYYSPEKVAERNKFDPFRMFKREDA